MSELKPYICTQCGGKVNRATLVCECCGTQFRIDTHDDIPRIQVVYSRPGVHMLCVNYEMTREMIDAMGYKEASKYVLEATADELAKSIAPYMEVYSERNPWRDTVTVNSRIRVLDPVYKFS